MNELSAGMVFRARFPFIRDTVTIYDADGPAEIKTWRPGVRMEQVYIPPDDCDTESHADGEGEMILTVVSVHKPGHFPTRVFFTRRWRSPDGKEFGKSACRCWTAEKFRRLAKGYAHPYKCVPQPRAGAKPTDNRSADGTSAPPVALLSAEQWVRFPRRGPT